MAKFVWPVLIGIIAIIGTVAYFNLQSQNQYLQAQLTKQQNNNLDMQAQCSIQAQKALVIYEQSWGAAAHPESFGQRNHYNQKLNQSKRAAAKSGADGKHCWYLSQCRTECRKHQRTSGRRRTELFWAKSVLVSRKIEGTVRSLDSARHRLA